MDNINITCKAAILCEQQKDLAVELIELPRYLLPGQVLVKMHRSTICGSQIGEIDGVKGYDKYIPHLLGHEGCGTVIGCGAGVSTVNQGDLVVLHWKKIRINSLPLNLN